MLAEPDALVASLLSASAVFTVPRFNSFSVGAIVVVMVNVSMFRWVFFGIRVVWGDLCHRVPF